MTKKQKLRRNSFSADFDTKEDDFILADLDVMLDEEEPSPVPLNHFLDDEETIDRLLLNTDFDANDKQEEDNKKPNPDAMVVDDTNLADDFSAFDQFVIEPIEQSEQNLLTQTEEISVLDIHSRATLDETTDEEDAIDRLLIDAGFDANAGLEKDDGAPSARVIDDINRTNGFSVNFKEQNAMADDVNIFDSEGSDLALDKDAPHVFLVKEEEPETAKQEQTISETTYPKEALEGLNNDAGGTMLSSVRAEQKAIKKQINHYKNKVKKAAIITYASLSIGIVALLSTVVMGVIVSGMQTKVSKLTELVSIIEEDISSIAEKNSDMEINNTDSSIEQLNQKVNGLPEQSEERSQFSSGMLESGKRAVVTEQAVANKSLDDSLPRSPVLEKKKLSEAAAGKVSAGKKIELQKHLISQSRSSVDLSKSKLKVVAKKQATLDKSIDNQKTKIHVVKEKKTSETTDKTSAKKKTNNAQSAADWSVNLTAYKELSYAKSKAAKFIQKGIPVKVIAVDMNNTTWYRLKVGGFNNKEKATTYADKIKKSLNLNTVSVGNS
ncbi:MAG: SPOR domain-containing protein [Methylococcaceae bacterium]|nr:SPOR domain-containing protein [Methylococcaceae bacterium]